MSRRRKSMEGLRFRVMVSMIAVAVLPLIAVVAILGPWAYRSVERQSLRLQQALVTDAESEIRAQVQRIEAELVLLDEVLGLATLPPEAQRNHIAGLVASDRLYEDLALVAPDGRETIRVARSGIVLASDLRDHAETAGFRSAVATRGHYIGAVEFQEEIRQPVMKVIVPIIDRRSGEVDSVLIARMRFRPIWDLLGQITEADEGSVYVVTDEGTVIAHRNPAVVLRRTTAVLPPTDGPARGLTGGRAVIATIDLKLPGERFVVVAEQPATAALEVATRSLQVTGGVGIAAVVIAAVLGILAARRVVKPIERLAESARRVSAGDLAHRTEPSGRGEIRDLAVAFNHMTERLQEAIETLEERVRERTVELEEAALVQQQLVTETETRNEQLEKMKTRLEALVSSKDEFLGSVSHELRTPLTSVAGFADEIRDRYDDFDDAERRTIIATIAEQAGEMASIIDDLLVAARRDMTRIFVDLTAVDVVAEIDAVLRIWPDASVTTRVPGGGVWARADEVRTRQILRNLLSNSIRYGGDNIEVRLAAAPDTISVQVRDNGSGIREGDWEVVFDAYETGHRDAGQPASVGLGLTVSRILARRMGGDLTYRFEENQSIFELTLPRARQAEDRVAADLAG